jgi:hypothetical protein
MLPPSRAGTLMDVRYPYHKTQNPAIVAVAMRSPRYPGVLRGPALVVLIVVVGFVAAAALIASLLAASNAQPAALIIGAPALSVAASALATTRALRAGSRQRHQPARLVPVPARRSTVLLNRLRA